MSNRDTFRMANLPLFYLDRYFDRSYCVLDIFVPYRIQTRKIFIFLNVNSLKKCLSKQKILFVRSRLNAAHMRQNVLERLPQMAEITLPTNYINWKSKQLILPPSTKQEHEWPATPPREPHYVLLRSDETTPQRLGKNVSELLLSSSKARNV